jgi:hypothetical protein
MPELKAKAFACARRHNTNHIVAVQDILDNLSLARAELGELEKPLQEIVNARHDNGLKSTLP